MGPRDPPEEMTGKGQAVRKDGSTSGRSRPKKQLEPDRLDGLNDELAELKFDKKKEGDETIEEVAEAVSRVDETGVTDVKEEHAAEDNGTEEPAHNPEGIKK